MQPYFYDEQLKKVSCYDYNSFLQTINLLTEKDIDVQRCGFTTAFNIFLKDGTNTNYVHWTEFFAALPSDFGIDIDVSKSGKWGQTFILFFNTAPVFEERSAVVTEDAPLISMEVEEDVVQEEDTVVVDWERINGMYSEKHKRQSKDDLELYCKNTFGVDLRKNQSFEKMVVELKEFLGVTD